MRLRDYLLMTGMTFLAAIAIGCSKPSKTNTLRNTSKPEVVSTTNNDSIDNRVICTGNGNGDNGDSDANGTGPDPLYQLVEDTIKKYDGLNGDNLPKDKASEYINTMRVNLEKLAQKDLNGLSTEQKSEISDAFTTYGYALRHSGKSKEAIQKYRIAIRLNPNSRNAHYNLGITLYHDNQPREAWEQMKRVLEINPDDRQATKSKGFLERKYGF